MVEQQAIDGIESEIAGLGRSGQTVVVFGGVVNIRSVAAYRRGGEYCGDSCIALRFQKVRVNLRRLRYRPSRIPLLYIRLDWRHRLHETEPGHPSQC